MNRTGKSAQRKGSQGERELAAALTSLLGAECRKGSSPFLPGIIAPDVLGVDGLHIEVKRRGRFSIPAAVRQSARDAHGNDVPIVAHRPNRSPWMITVELNHLPALAAAIMAILAQGPRRTPQDAFDGTGPCATRVTRPTLYRTKKRLS